MESAERYEQFDKSSLISFLVDRDQELTKLQHLLYQASKKTFGKKTERLEPNGLQGCLFDFTPEQTDETQSSESITVPEHKRTLRRGRKPLAAELPRETFLHEPEQCACPTCANDLVEVSRETTEILEKIPARYLVQEHIKISKSCPCCKDAIYSGKLPNGVQPLERSRPGPGLLTEILINKYCNHLPLHRQEEMFLRDGVIIPRQRMSDWLETLGGWFISLSEAILKEILQGLYAQADETTLDVQDRKDKRNLVHGYLWGVHGPPNLIYFQYNPSRRSEVAEEIFKDFTGTVQTDLYAGYNQIYLPDRCLRVACLAHVRRKFLEVEKLASKDVGKVLGLIAGLYKIEKEIKLLSADERLAARQVRSRKILDNLFTYLENWKMVTMPKSLAMPAIEYALKQKTEIYRFTDSAEYQIDNNAIERQMRPIAIGRKNWLFAGSHDGAKRSAAFFSILQTCKLCGVNPTEYIRDMIVTLPDYPKSKLHELLPHRWKLAKESKTS